VIEGPTLVADALDAGLALESGYVEDGIRSAAIDDVVGRLTRASVPLSTVGSGGLARVLDTVTPQGVAAVASIPSADLADLDAADVVLVLVGVSDPGNAGTLIRAAEAAGAGGVVVGGDAVDPFSPKCVRASAGSIFRVPTVVVDDTPAALRRWGERGRRRFGTAARQGASYARVDFDPPLAIVLGSETHGLPEDVAAEVDEWLHIPMTGRVDSLNVAVAGALLLFEAARRRDSTGRQLGGTAGWTTDD
jgi:TrmH family RNA methyltransferase